MYIPIIVISIIALDQISKFAVRHLMIQGQSIPIIDNFLSITYIQNSGVAFSFLSGNRLLVTLLQIVAMVIIAVILFKLKGTRKIYDIAFSMILAGGIGNVMDRIFLGSVTDMISFSIFPPIFNVADIGVTLGCALLIIDIIRDFTNA